MGISESLNLSESLYVILSYSLNFSNNFGKKRKYRHLFLTVISKDIRISRIHGLNSLFVLFSWPIGRGRRSQTSWSSEISKLSLGDVPKGTRGLVAPEGVILAYSCDMLELANKSELVVFKDFKIGNFCELVDVTLLTWTLWWKYLHHRNWQLPQTRHSPPPPKASC